MARLQSNGHMLDGALATGSYWLDDDAWYLITNWHNITGCHPVTRAAMSGTGFLPTHVKLNYIVANTVEATEEQQLLNGARTLLLFMTATISHYGLNTRHTGMQLML